MTSGPVVVYTGALLMSKDHVMVWGHRYCAIKGPFFHRAPLRLRLVVSVWALLGPFATQGPPTQPGPAALDLRHWFSLVWIYIAIV